MESITEGFCACGCGKQVSRRLYSDRRHGWKRGEFVTFARGHNRSRRPNPPYLIDAQTGCWIWQGHLQGTRGKRTGSVLRPDGRRVSAYAAFYIAAKGPIPAGLVLDHLCRNPSCVNPDHLEAVTYGVDRQRGSCAKLSAADVALIRAELKRGVKRRQLSKRFNVSYTAIRQIDKGASWS